MSHDPSASPVESTSKPKLIRVTLKSSGKTQDCQVNEKSTVAELKNEASLHFLLSKEQVLLIFAGKILKDQESLLQHGIQSGDMVHVVAKRLELRANHVLQTRSVAPGSSTPGTAAGTSESAGGITLRSTVQGLLSKETNPLTVAFILGVSSLLPQLVGTLATPDMGLEADMLDDLQSFHQLFVDIRQVLSGPEVQDELEERMLRHTIETSPSLVQLAKENARIGHLLSNPKVVGEIIRYIRKPEVKQEMDRHCDRILSNIESFPGGYNILQHMYKEMEEPIWSVMEQQHQHPSATQGGSPASNQGIEGEFIKFSDDTKLAGIVNILEDKLKIQKDLDRLEQWALSNKMKFNVEKSKVLHLSRKKPRYKYRLGRNSNCERDLGVLVDDDLNMS
uniref:Ubiquitin-like domain-containing protein n=1 Tax=Laticauda laticaudata TaxID=8630 RepID=A0A8C5RTB7_LATLA